MQSDILSDILEMLTVLTQVDRHGGQAPYQFLLPSEDYKAFDHQVRLRGKDWHTWHGYCERPVFGWGSVRVWHEDDYDPAISLV